MVDIKSIGNSVSDGIGGYLIAFKGITKRRILLMTKLSLGSTTYRQYLIPMSSYLHHTVIWKVCVCIERDELEAEKV